MKALTLDKAKRYPTIAAFSADIEAYQNGFATRAENASLMKQLILLIQRHKGVFATAAAAWLVITALAVWFVLSIRASERETRRHAAIAEANEKKAVERGESTRRALANAQIALAESAYRDEDAPAMQTALDLVPEDLRDTNWQYLLAHTDMSLGPITLEGGTLADIAADPSRPGVFALASKGRITFMELRSRKKLEEFAFDAPEEARAGGYRIAVSPDGRRVAVGHDVSPGILILDAKDGRKIAHCEAKTTAKLQFSPDNHRLLVTSPYGLMMWDAQTGAAVWKESPKGFGNGSKAVLTPDGRRVFAFVANSDVRFCLLNAEDGSVINRLTALDPPGGGVALAVSLDGKLGLVGGSTGWMAGVDMEAGRVVFKNRMGSLDYSQFAFTPDGGHFVVASSLSDGRQSIKICDSRTGQPLRALLGGINNLLSMSLHPVSGEIATTGPNPRLWALGVTPPKWVNPNGNAAVRWAHFWNSDDEFFSRAKQRGGGVLLNLTSGEAAISSFEGAGAGVASSMLLTISSNSQIAAFDVVRSVTLPTTIHVLRKGDDGKAEESAVFETVQGGRSARDIRLSPAGDRIVAFRANMGSKPWVLDSSTGKVLATLAEIGAFRGVADTAWSADGTQLISLVTLKANRGDPGAEETIILWDAATGKPIFTTTHPTTLDYLAMSPDGRSFIEAGTDRMIRIRDAATLKVRREFRAHDGPITALAWSPKANVIASASADLTIKLWDAETGKLLEELHGPTSAPTVVNFSPSGKRLASTGTGDATRVWEPESLNAKPAGK